MFCIKSVKKKWIFIWASMSYFPGIVLQLVDISLNQVNDCVHWKANSIPIQTLCRYKSLSLTHNCMNIKEAREKSRRHLLKSPRALAHKAMDS